MEGLLYLEDGTTFKGKGFGFAKTAVGELVFNTSMTGYQEILTDPSYAGQIINFTYPLIGNYGISLDDNESPSIHAFGMVAKNICFEPSNYKSVTSIDQWLFDKKVPGIFEIDTRAVTRRIRSQGAMKCVISSEGIAPAEAKALCAASVLKNDYMKRAGVREVTHIEGSGSRVSVLDFGMKANILRSFVKRGCDVYLFPYGSTAEELLSVQPDGVFLTNGPGDPEEAFEAISEVKKLFGRIPMFGICMGHQVLALAAGGKTFKMSYGHRGGNHGVFDKETGRSYITSQNHGYMVDSQSIILRGMEVTHFNLNDGTVEGMKHNNYPIFSVQYHPEASPGPCDSDYLFDRFMRLMEDHSPNRSPNRTTGPASAASPVSSLAPASQTSQVTQASQDVQVPHAEPAAPFPRCSKSESLTNSNPSSKKGGVQNA